MMRSFFGMILGVLIGSYGMFYYAYTEATNIYRDKLLNMDRVVDASKAFANMLTQTRNSGKAAVQDLGAMATGGIRSTPAGATSSFEALSEDIAKTKKSGEHVITTTRKEAASSIDRTRTAIQLWILKHRGI